MLSQRVTLGIGLAILLLISAASIGMDVKSRSDAAWVDHTLDVLNKISDLRRLLRGAESASRGFALTSDQAFIDEFRAANARIPTEFADLLATISDDPRQTAELRSIEGVIDRRLAILAELLRLHSLGNSAAVAELMSKAEGRAVMASLTASFDRMTAEERRLLAIRTAASKASRSLLLAVDLAGVALILILAFIMIRGAYRSRRKLEDSLSASQAVAQAQQEVVRHSASVLENTFKSIAEAVLVIDTNGAVVLSNPAATQMLGYGSGMTIADLWIRNAFCRPDGVTALTVDERPSTRALRGEHVDRKEVVVRPMDGGKPVHAVVSGRPLRDAAGRISGASIVFHDISDVQDIERKLQQAQKLEALGKLTGGVAHDFNNMLTVITGTTEILMAELEGRPEALETAGLINEAADRCTELIQHLLAFARRQPLRPRDVDVNAVVLDITKLLRPTLGEQIEIQAALEAGVATAHIDSAQLANSLVNMAINARDAMPRGGKLLFETHDVVVDEAYAQANPGVVPGSYVMLAVSDTGTGMPPDVRDRVFEPFFTTKEVGKGSGLGLSMVYGFVQQSGGHIKIYSEEGHGTTIRLYLPPTAGTVQARTAEPASISAGDETILVVEDDELVRRFVISELRSLGYNTVSACDSREALSHVDRGQRFDLLFTDVIMPGGMNGPQLADEVARRRPGTRVLYTSAYTENAIVHHGRLDEGVLLLSKPYRKAQLAQMIRLALDDSVQTGAAEQNRLTHQTE
ncbi:CHASE3 domain-containing protein [Bradyrhizobium sp.]|uniref:CHASE3 domain-containing protein n=1 Tax=Bradyrhizobium sp. TaxID=376 RepID=UPI003C587909